MTPSAFRPTSSPPRDVAEVVVFLATSEPSFITGQDFIVDGFQWVL